MNLDGLKPSEDDASPARKHRVKIAIHYILGLLCIFVLISVPAYFQNKSANACDILVFALMGLLWNISLTVLIFLSMLFIMCVSKYIFDTCPTPSNGLRMTQPSLYDSAVFAWHVVTFQMSRRQASASCGGHDGTREMLV